MGMPTAKNGELASVFGTTSAAFVHNSVTVGASCLLLGLPAPYIMLLGYPGTALFNLLVTACLAIRSVWDDIDRVVACAYVVWVTYLSLQSNGLWQTVAVLLALVLAPFWYSRLAASRTQWVFRHSVWHVCGMLVQFVIMHGVQHRGVR